jgi:parallel beta-helix repeat protein
VSFAGFFPPTKTTTNKKTMKSKHLGSVSRPTLLLGLLTCAVLCLAGTHKAAAQTQPPNSLSIVTYGASTGASDNTAAIQNCINAAQSQARGVWIPAGTWRVTGSLHATGITITGAGMTTAIIYRQQNSSSVVATSLELLRCTVRDLGIDGNGTSRGVNASYGINMKGVGWLVERVKVSHSDAGMWMSGSSGTVQNCQLINVFADGVNLNNANGPDALGANLTVQNCLVDGSGDDGIAINSQGISLGRQNMQNPKVLNNETRNSRAANGLRIAGGVNSIVTGNNVHDQSTGENGIQIGKFSSDGFQLTGGQCNNNTFARVAGVNDCAAIWVYEDAQCTIAGNNIVDSKQHGFRIGSCNITLGDNNTINHPAKRGIWIMGTSSGSPTHGSANIKNNTVLNLNAGQPAFLNEAGSAMSVTLTGNSWQGGGGTGVVFYADTNFGGAASQALPVGTYTLAQLASRGMPNDWASSVRVPAGRTVIMYSDDNFTGTSWTRTADTANFTTLTPNANDAVSSVRVQ